MALSNTAVPKYYAQFKDAVLRGEIPVCQEISMYMNIIDERIASPACYYNEEAVECWIRYCEKELTLVDGSDVVMLDSFKLWGEDLFGWYYYQERSVWVPGTDGARGYYERRLIPKRLINKQYLIVGRSAAKTLYMSFVQSYMQNCDTSTTEQVTVAPTMKQAEEVITPLITAMNRAKGPLFKFLTDGSLQNTTGNRLNRQKLASTKKGIQNFLTNSIIKVLPMSIDKLQGLRVKVVTIDEWLSCDIREDIVGAVEQGAAKIDGYIIILASSEGTVRNGIGDTIKMELTKILKREYNNPHVSIFWYKLDSVEEVSNPAMWLKANPNLGKTVTYETYQLDVERAEQAPSTRNDILAKRFGIPLEGYTYYFTYDETLPHEKNEYWGMPCAMGADLSQGDDFTAFTFLFPVYGAYGIKSRAYITELALSKLPGALRLKYEEFMEEGSLIIMPGKVLDMPMVYEDLDAYIQRSDYDVRAFGFDPYNAKDFVERWISENGSMGVEKVIQGKKTESVPLGELKILAHERSLLFDEKIMSFCMGNCITIEDVNGNRMLLKKRYEHKIDCVSAMMDAYIAYKLHKEDFE